MEPQPSTTENGKRSMRATYERITDAAWKTGSRLFPIASVDQRLPLMFDMVEDAARSRGFTLALFALMITFLFRSGLYVLFLTNPIQSTQSQQLMSLNFMPSEAELGKVPGPAITIRITDTSGKPVSSVMVNIKMTLQRTDPPASWIDHFGYTDTFYDTSGIPVNGRYALPGFPPRVLAVPTLRGDTAASDVDGYARFRSLRMLTGLAESYQVAVTAAGTTLSLGNLRFTSRVVQVVILGIETVDPQTSNRSVSSSSFRRPITVQLGQALPAIRVRVLGEQGAPLADKTAVLICAPPDADEFASVGLTNDIFHPRSALLSNQRSSLTGIDGTTTLRNVSLVASSIRRLRFWVVVDGIVGQTVDGQRSLAFTLGPRTHIPRRNKVYETLSSRKLAPGDTLLDEYHIQLVSQPAASVMEGEVLSQQPAVSVHRFVRSSEGRLRLLPALGARVYAFPYQQGGFKSDTIMGPEASSELGIVKGNKWAILGSLGRMKHVFNGTSLPADEQGIARFEGLGFIRHGPAGNYTLSFAHAGVHLYAESRVVEVRTSVARVLHMSPDVEWSPFVDKAHRRSARQGAGLPWEKEDFWDWLPESSSQSPRSLRAVQPRTTSIICTYPTCQSILGNAAGSTSYFKTGEFGYGASQMPGDALLQSAPGRNGTWRLSLPDIPLFPASLSGRLLLAPIILVSDSFGRPLAGKTPEPDILQAQDPLSQSPCSIHIEEFPGRGSTVSKLGMPGDALFVRDIGFPMLATQTSSVLGWQGIAAYASQNLDSGQRDEKAWYAQIAPKWSHFRVMSSSSLVCNATWQFRVEGVSDEDQPAALEVYNWNMIQPEPWRPAHQPAASTLCSSIRIVQAPSMVLQDGAQQASAVQSPGLFLGPDGTTPMPFVVETINSQGQAVPTVDVRMYVTDALGYVMYTASDEQHLGITSDYADFLRASGGASVFGAGIFLTGLDGTWLHPHATANTTDAVGRATFDTFTVRRAQNTWFRVAFVAKFTDLTKLDLIGKNLTSADQPNDIQAAAASTFWSSSHTCVSQYSAPIVVRSTIDAVSWAAPRALARAANASSPTEVGHAGRLTLTQPWNSSLPLHFELPLAVELLPSQLLGPESAAISPLALPPVRLMGAVDEALVSYPANVGIRLFQFMPVPTKAERQLLYDRLWPVLGTDYDRFADGLFTESLQVASLGSGVPSILGSSASIFQPVSGQSFAHASMQTSCSNATCSVLGSFAPLAARIGEAGEYELTVFAGGHVAEPGIVVDLTTEATTIVVDDFDVETYGNTTSCYEDNTAYFNFSLQQLYYPLPDQPNPCPAGLNGMQCSGHGVCMCGFCLCTDNWDGAYDCSRRYVGDSFSSAFAQLEPEWGLNDYPGLPVYDVGRAMRMIHQQGTVFHTGDIFPRFILGKTLGVGRMPPDVAEYFPFIASYNPSVPGLPGAEVVKDQLNAAWLGKLDAWANRTAQPSEVMDFLKMFAPELPATGHYSVVPVLFSCGGEEVQDWSFVEAETGCPADVVTVMSVPTDQPGKSTFVAYRADYYTYSAGQFFTEPRIDKRLHLYGLPTGCYRFKYVYAPRGPGSRLARRIDEPWDKATARSLGSGRPFRVISPIEKFENGDFQTAEDDIIVVHDTPVSLPYMRVKLNPATVPDVDLGYVTGNAPQLKDSCSDVVENVLSSAATGLPKYRGRLRCGPTPAGGLEVTYTAVSATTGAEYSLYTQTSNNDCWRTDTATCSDSGSCPASQQQFIFPSSPAAIPYGAGRRTAQAVRTPSGRYRLRFTSYGTSALSKEVFRVLDGPTHLLAANDIRLFFPADAPSTLNTTFFSEAGFTTSLGMSESDQVQPTRVFAGAFRRKDVGFFGTCDSSFEPVCPALPYLFPNRTTLPHFALLLYLLCVDSLGEDAPWNLPESILAQCAQSADTYWLYVPSVTFTVRIRYGPAYANAITSPELTIVTMLPQAKFATAFLPLVSGSPGWYVFTVSVQDSGAEDAVMVLNVSNPVSSVQAEWRGSVIRPSPARHPCAFTTKGNAPLAEAPWTSTFTAIETEAVPGVLSVCALGLPLQTRTVSGRTLQYRAHQRLTFRFVLPLQQSIYGDNCTLVQPKACQSTPLSSEPVWLQSMRNSIERELVDMSCPDQVDPRRQIDLGARLTISRSVSGKELVETGLLGELPQLHTGDDGCAEISGLTFSRVSATANVRLVVSIRGIEAPPLDFRVITLAEARPVSTNELQRKIAIPVAAAMPAFGANIVSLPVRVRALCLIVGSLSLAVMAGTEGQAFFQDYVRLTSIFAEKDTAFILALNIFWLCSTLIVAYYCVIEFVQLRHHLKRWVQTAYKRWRGKLPSKTEYEVFGANKDKDRRRVAGSFYSRRYEAAWLYVQTRLPRLGPQPQEERDKRPPAQVSKAQLSRVQAWMKWVHDHVPRESPELAFFYPQRLLVALVVSILCCSLVVMLLLYLAGHLADYADAALAFIVGAQQRAATAVAEASMRQADVLSSSVNVAVDWAASQSPSDLSASTAALASEAGTAGAEKALLENAIAAALEANFAGRADGSFAGLPPALSQQLSRVQSLGFLPTDSLLSGGASLTSTKLLSMLQQLQSSQTDLLRPYLDAAILQLRTSIMHGVVLGIVLVSCTWCDLFVTYRKAVLTKRSGKRNEFPYGYGWEDKACSPGKAVTFVGVQAAGASITLLLASVVFCGLSLALSVPQSLQMIQQYVVSTVSALLGITFLLTLLRQMMLSCVVVRNRQIVLRNVFAVFDLWFTFFNIVTGLAIAAIRLALSIVSFLAVLMRPDYPVASLLAGRDPATGSFMALLHLDCLYHNPTYLMATSLLLAMHEEKLRAKIAPVQVDLQGQPSVSKASLPTSVPSTQHVRANAVPAVRALVQPPAQKGAAGFAVNPLAQCGPAAAMQGAAARTVKSTRARTRWWLYSMLSAHPGLRLHRKHALRLLTMADESENEMAEGGLVL